MRYLYALAAFLPLCGCLLTDNPYNTPGRLWRVTVDGAHVAVDGFVGEPVLNTSGEPTYGSKCLCGDDNDIMTRGTAGELVSQAEVARFEQLTAGIQGRAASHCTARAQVIGGADYDSDTCEVVAEATAAVRRNGVCVIFEPDCPSAYNATGGAATQGPATTASSDSEETDGGGQGGGSSSGDSGDSGDSTGNEGSSGGVLPAQAQAGAELYDLDAWSDVIDCRPPGQDCALSKWFVDTLIEHPEPVLQDDIGFRIGETAGVKGARLVASGPGSLSSALGFQRGDLITHVNGMRVVDNLYNLLPEFVDATSVKLDYIDASGQKHSRTITKE